MSSELTAVFSSMFRFVGDGRIADFPKCVTIWSLKCRLCFATSLLVWRRRLSNEKTRVKQSKMMHRSCLLVCFVYLVSFQLNTSIFLYLFTLSICLSFLISFFLAFFFLSFLILIHAVHNVYYLLLVCISVNVCTYVNVFHVNITLQIWRK